MPEGAITVTRPGAFGNPFAIGQWHKIGKGGNGMARLACWEAKQAIGPGWEYCSDAAKAVELYRRYVALYPLKQDDLAKLRGKNLACWCPLVDKDGKPVPCHADILIDLANK